LTWPEYINKGVVDKFKAAYKAKVKFIYFDSDNAADEMLTTYGADKYYLILGDSVSIPFYKKLGWVRSFNLKNAPNLEDVKLPFLSNLDKKDPICANYAWGTTGIAYRKNLLPEPITSWKQIFDPATELQGKILISPIVNEVVGMALKYLGYSMGSGNKRELEEARQLLLNQALSVVDYSSGTIDPEISKLVSGEISVSLAYSSHALLLKEAEPKIEYVLPKEGGAIWAYFVCLSAKANNLVLAHHFINQPEQAANNALSIYAATPNREAEKRLPAEFLNNPVIYQSKVAAAQSETYQALHPYTIKKQNLIMNELRKKLH